MERRGGPGLGVLMWPRGLLALASIALLCGVLLSGGVTRGAAATGSAAAAAGCSRTAQLAYVAAKHAGAKGTVWLAAANGAGRQRLFSAATPALAPSGKLVAVTDPGHGAGLGVFTACGGLVGKWFGAREAVSGITWSSDSSLLSAIVDPNPNGNAFAQTLVIINVATGQLTTIAKGFLGQGGPTFSPTAPYQVAYTITLKPGRGTNVWSGQVGSPARQESHGNSDVDPVWGPQGILYIHQSDAKSELEVSSGGRSTGVMSLKNAWPVAVSSDGTHLAAEGAACGVVWPVSVDLATRKIVHQFANGFAPYGISPSGGSMLIAGSPPGANCGGPASVIETVPFSGGKPKVIAKGIDPSWADSAAANTQP